MKDVSGHPGYKVSADGDVFDKHGEKVNVYLCSGGYPTVSIGGSYRGTRVHRLVAAAFLENYNPGLHVNHIDGNKKNNNASNLEMVTNSENLAHAWRTGLCQPKYGDEIAFEARRLATLRLGQREIAEATGTSVAWVGEVLNGRVKRYGDKVIDRRTSGKSPEVVLDIYRMASEGATLVEVSKRYRISKSQAWNIINGISYPELHSKYGPVAVQRKMKPRKGTSAKTY